MVGPGALLGGAFGAAADRFSRRLIASAGAFGFAASLAVFAAGGSFAALALASFVMGAASTAMVEAAEVALVDLAAEDLRRYLARSNLFGTVGDLLGPALIAAVAAVGLSWRVAFALGSALLALYGLALTASPLPPPARADGDGDSARRVLAAVIRDPAVWVVGLIGLLMGPFDEPLVGFTIALLEHDRGTSAFVATVVALIGVSGGLLSYTVLARRFERVGDQRLLLGAVTAMAVGAVTIAVMPLLAVLAVAAFATSVGLNLAWLALQHRSLTLRPGQVGTTNAVLGAIEFAGFGIPVAIGALADRAGLAAAVAAFGTLGAGLIGLAWSDLRRAGRARLPGRATEPLKPSHGTGPRRQSHAPGGQPRC
jgi:predicted MFS family arabinose efflux permease